METNSKQKSREYNASEKEMERRKKAFIRLSGSFFTGMCLFSADAILSLPQLFVPVYVILAVILWQIVLQVNKTQDSQKKMRIRISENELEWIFARFSDQRLFADIKGIRIKRTVKGLIREVRIAFNGIKYLYINGLEDFENFTDDLIASTKGVTIQKLQEPIDFDHPLFYLCLGTFLGISVASLFRLIALIGENQFGSIQIACACPVIFAGLWLLLINKPIRGRYGSRNVTADYLGGTVFLAAGVLIAIKAILH